jgi:hypothetical protein
MIEKRKEVNTTMCTPMQNQSFDCKNTCGCHGFLEVEDEIKMLEATKVKMQVQLDQIERRIAGLKGRI